MFKLTIKPAYIYISLILVLVITIIWQITKSKPVRTLTNDTFTLPSGIHNQNPAVNYQIQVQQQPITAKSMPLFAAAYELTEKTKQQLAQQYEFGEPQNITVDDFQKYLWSSGEETLSYYPLNNTMAYFNPAILRSSIPPSSTITNQALTYIKSKLTIPSLITLTPYQTNYITSNGTVNQQVKSAADADLVEIEYRYLLNDQPIYLAPYEQPDVTIDINADGVRILKAKIPPVIKTLNQNAPIISQTEAQQELIANQGIILKVNDTDYYETGPLFNISEMNVTNVALGYVINKQTLTPAYIFRGTAINKDDPSTSYVIETAVLAVKQPEK